MLSWTLKRRCGNVLVSTSIPSSGYEPVRIPTPSAYSKVWICNYVEHVPERMCVFGRERVSGGKTICLSA